MKINEIIILIIFSIIISSCTAIPKPNPDKPDSILIVPVSVTNKSKHPITQQFQFTFSNKDDGSEVFHTYLPKVDNSYLIIKNLKPGNYQFLRVSNSKNSKIKKELSNSTFKMEDDTITIIQDQFVYEQTVRGGDWYTYNFNTSYLNKGGYNKLIEKLEENENFKSWKIRCKWCNKSDTSSPVMRPVGYTSSNASATSNLFVLKEVTSEFSVGDIVTFGDSKKEYEIREAKVLKKSESGNIQGIVLYKGYEFKISPGSGNIQGIVIKGAVGFKISPGMKVSVVKETDVEEPVRLVSPNGDVYVGEVMSGKPHGQGTLTFPDGRMYVGQYKDGKEHGKGTLTSPSGDEYVGEWKDGRPNGRGTEIFPDGSKGIGEFRDGEDWNTTLYDKDGNITKKYVNGELQE